MLGIAKKGTASRAVNLFEYTLTGGNIDRSNAILRNVKILGQVSDNGRVYSDNAMRQAVKLYEGVDVNLDHPDRKTPGANRSVRDRIGRLVNVRLKEGAVRGDLQLIKNHPFTGAILDMAESNTRGIGLSHNASGESSPTSDGMQLVESLNRVRSVDIVQHPATNNSFFEGQVDSGSTEPALTLPDDLSPDKQQRIQAVLSDASLDDTEKIDQIRAILIGDNSDTEDSLPVDAADMSEKYMTGTTRARKANIKESTSRLMESLGRGRLAGTEHATARSAEVEDMIKRYKR